MSRDKKDILQDIKELESRLRDLTIELKQKTEEEENRAKERTPTKEGPNSIEVGNKVYVLNQGKVQIDRQARYKVINITFKRVTVSSLLGPITRAPRNLKKVN